VENYFRYPEMLFYKQSITNLLIDSFDDDADMQFKEPDVYSYTLFVQLILMKMIAHYKLPVNVTQLFTALEARLDSSNNMNLYNEVIENSSAGYNKNIDRIKGYFGSINLEDEEEDTLKLHYTTVHSILFNKSGIYSGDHTMLLLMSAGYDTLGMNGITQLYLQNILKCFYYDYIKNPLAEIELTKNPAYYE